MSISSYRKNLVFMGSRFSSAKLMTCDGGVRILVKGQVSQQTYRLKNMQENQVLEWQQLILKAVRCVCGGVNLLQKI